MDDPIADPFADDSETRPIAAESDLTFEPTDDVPRYAPPSDEGPSMDNVDLNADEKKGGNIFPPSLNKPKPSMSTAASGSGIYEITVSAPEKKGEGMSAYVVYKVNTKVETSAGKFRQSTVLRRYSDFAWLRNRLVSAETGWLVPPMPGKALMRTPLTGRFDAFFIENRRRYLELFLNRLAHHPELSKFEDVRLFLHGAEEFEEAKTGKVPPPEAKPAKGLFGFVNELAQSVSNTWGQGKEREKTKDDIACESIAAYADQLDTTVAAVHKNIETMTINMKDIATAWFDFGFSCTLLGQFETEQEDQHLGNAFAKLGNCADRLSVLLTQKVDNQITHFQEPFDDFLRSVQSVKEMLKARSAALLSYQTALSTLESRQAALDKVQGRIGKEDKASQAEAAVLEAQQKVDAELQQLNEVTQRVFSETNRFKDEKRINFKNIMKDFVRVQIENARKAQTAWESVVADIEAMPYDAPP